MRTTCTIVLLTGLVGAPALTAQAPMPPGAEARSLLGHPLVPPPLPPAVRAVYQARLDSARRAFDRTPDDPDSLIWLGRRTAYLGRYREAISIFTDGIRRHPGDARMYRHRGHRYLTIRELDQAIVDFDRATALIEDKPDQVEPDGLPNARGIPTSTLHSNIRYHRGLAHYLKGHFDRAVHIFREDVDAALATGNADMLVASSHWLYMALRRAGRPAEAARVLEPITRELPVIENGSYHRLLLMYQGRLPADSLMPKPAGDDAGVEDVTLAYGVANWHLYNGRRAEAERLFRQILATPQWAAFGFLAAEAEVARTAGPEAQARIPEIKTTGSTPCEVHPETAVETAELWLSARAALESSTANDSTPPVLLVQKWRRRLSRSFKTMYVRRDTATVATRQPFGVETPSSIERAGYIQRMLHTVIFYGPDPDEIITERFLRQHCFRRVLGSGATEGLVGLGFDPLPRQQKPDVSGILWIEPRSGALRYVAYTWTNPPAWADGGKAEGRTDFVRLASRGGWITQRWYIRMPRPVDGLSHEFDGYDEAGGELLAVGPPAPRKKN